MSELVINDILCYISTARNSKTDDSIIQCCLPFYSISRIKEAKALLFKYTSDRPKSRRGDNLQKNEITDILDLFRKCEETNTDLPKFVSESYDSMPPTSGFELIGNTIVSLIEEIQTLRDEIKIIKDSSIRENILIDDTTHIKTDLMDIKENIRDLKLKVFSQKIDNMNKESLLNDSLNDFIKSNRKSSMPHALINFDDNKLIRSTLDDTICASQPSLLNIDQISDSIPQMNNSKQGSPLKNNLFQPSAPPLSQEALSCDLYSQKLKHQTEPSNKQVEFLPIESNQSEINTNQNIIQAQIKKSNDDFKTANLKRRKRQFGVVGVKENVNHLSAMKSAPRFYDLYVGRCNPQITVDILNDYLKEDHI